MVNANKKNPVIGDLLTPSVKFGLQHGACNAIKDLIRVTVFGK